MSCLFDSNVIARRVKPDEAILKLVGRLLRPNGLTMT